MSCLAWNCRGLGIPRAKKELEDLIRAQAPLIVFLSETWADKEQLERLKYNVKFASLFVVNSQDRGGGLALLWQHGVQVWVDSFSRFHIDAIIQGGSREAWRFTGFYGEPDTNEREEAWNMLRMLHSKPYLPWVCMGDFNEILLSEEKHGGRARPHSQMQAFRDVLDTCGFLDLGFTGPEFTWNGNRHGYVIWERWDRGVANYDWMARFLTVIIRHLHCVASNHRPILLVFDPNGEATRWKHKPFRFEEMWLAEKECGATVKRAWEIQPSGNHMYRVVTKIKKCKKLLKSWSKEHFGSIKNQLRLKKELLWKAEEDSAKGGNHEVVVQLHRELNVLLDKENRMWSQRSRAQWLACGDRNTKFFHGVAT